MKNVPLDTIYVPTLLYNYYYQHGYYQVENITININNTRIVKVPNNLGKQNSLCICMYKKAVNFD